MTGETADDKLKPVDDSSKQVQTAAPDRVRTMENNEFKYPAQAPTHKQAPRPTFDSKAIQNPELK